MKIGAVVFDMDGLMIDSERVVQYSWGVAGKRMGYDHLDEDIYHTLGLNRKGRERFFRQKYGESFPFEYFLEEYRKEYAAYMKAHGIPPKKGLYQLLSFLKEKNIPLAIATSSSEESAVRSLKELGVYEDFGGYVFGDMVTHSKPHPEIYERACAAIGSIPEETVALEDSVNGIKSAYRAGLIPVMVPDLVRDTREADPLLAARKRDLQEVAEWIREQMT